MATATWCRQQAEILRRCARDRRRREPWKFQRTVGQTLRKARDATSDRGLKVAGSTVHLRA
jgi:hypothetical protein